MQVTIETCRRDTIEMPGKRVIIPDLPLLYYCI